MTARSEAARRYPKICECCGRAYKSATRNGRFCSRECAHKCIPHKGWTCREKPPAQPCMVRVVADVPVFASCRPRLGGVYAAERLPGLDRSFPRPAYAVMIGGRRILLRQDECVELPEAQAQEI